MTQAAGSRRNVGVVLAAGKGTRMKSELPKVLHPVAGRPMLHWVLDALEAAGCEQILVVVGHGSDAVSDACADREVTWVEQREQLGTGHALAQVASRLDQPARLLVLSGDVPMVSAGTLARLIDSSARAWGSMAVARLEAPGGLGRVVVGVEGGLDRIVEAVDASMEELSIDLVNAGLYCLPAPEIFECLDRVRTDNAKGEVYLTDALGLAAGGGDTIELVELEDAFEAHGVNDRLELARVHRRMMADHLAGLAESGVTILDPERTVVEPGVQVGADTVLHPGVSLIGETSVGGGCELHQGAWLRDTQLGERVTVEAYSVLDGARVHAQAKVGPFARLRPGADVGPSSKVGNFVEIKNSQLGAGAKAGHLAYIGDATVGEGANIGAGTITCNYDGFSKHRTEIGDRAFIGSDTMLVAPVRVGKDATTGAGSAITKDVPDGALAVERSAQRTVEGWAERQRKKVEKD